MEEMPGLARRLSNGMGRIVVASLPRCPGAYEVAARAPRARFSRTAPPNRYAEVHYPEDSLIATIRGPAAVGFRGAQTLWVMEGSLHANGEAGG